MKKLLSIILAIALVMTMFTGCGSKSVDGYYTFTSDRYGYALEISGNRATMHYFINGIYNIYTLEADVEKTDEGADLYFEASERSSKLQLKEYNPMHVRLSDDGERMYLSSDSSGWITDTYDKVSKKKFDETIEGWQYW